MTGKQLLPAAIEAMSPRQQAVAHACLEHYAGEWQRIRFTYGPSVAYTMHGMLDERIAHLLTTAPRAKDVQCRKGCAACCHLNVDITPQEAELLVAWMREQGIEIDRQRLERQAEKTGATWNDLSHEDQRCVFLGEDRNCTVYEHRPGACRKYLVVTPPKFCDSQKYPGHDVGILFDIEAELMHAAAQKTYGMAGLAAQLIEARA